VALLQLCEQKSAEKVMSLPLGWEPWRQTHQSEWKRWIQWLSAPWNKITGWTGWLQLSFWFYSLSE